jgi:uncharacterized protein
MRRQERELSHSEALAILGKGEYGVLSMCMPANAGYGVPLNYAFNNTDIYFHSAKEGLKLEYLRNNPNVSFCVVGKTTVLPAFFGTLYESVIAEGTTSEVEGTEKLEALKMFIEKYSGEFIQEGNEYITKLLEKVTVIRLTVKSVTGKARKQ